VNDYDIAFGGDPYQAEFSGDSWPNYPMSKLAIYTTQNPDYGFFIGRGGPDWSQVGVCDANDRQSTLIGTDKFEQKHCMIDYSGAIFAAFWNESSSNSYRSLDEMSIDFNFSDVNVANHRYLYARTTVNGILDTVGALGIIPGRLEEAYQNEHNQGIGYFSTNFSGSLGKLAFNWICGNCIVPPIPTDAYTPLRGPVYIGNNDVACPEEENQALCEQGVVGNLLHEPLVGWLKQEIEKTYLRFQTNDNSSLIYVGNAYHEFLPYVYAAIHDVIYRDPAYTNPPSNDNQDPFARLFMAKAATYCPPINTVTKYNAEGKPYLACNVSPLHIATAIQSSDVASIDTENCSMLLSYYRQQLQTFTSIGYKTEGPSRHAHVLRYQFANGGDMRADIRINSIDNDYLYFTGQNVTVLNPTRQNITSMDPQNPAIPYGRQRWEITGYTWITFSFQQPGIWFTGSNNTQSDPLYPFGGASLWSSLDGSSEYSGLATDCQ